MANPAEIKKTINKAAGNLAFISGWEGRNGVRYRQVFSNENNCVYLVEAADEREKDMDALLIYHPGLAVYDASDKLVAKFFRRDDYWYYRDLLVDPNTETKCIHSKRPESLLESEVLFSKHWLERKKVKQDEKPTNDFTIRPKTEREVRLEHQLRSALSVLRDLDRGHSWREMNVDVNHMLAQAREVGVDLEDELGLEVETRP